MKLILTSAVATLIATTAFADNSDRHSDRYNDMRLDTSKAAQTTTDDQKPAAKTTLSTRNWVKKSDRKGNASPYGGVGPNNDSR